MKLLITGGAGFIGSHFVDKAFSELDSSDHVVVLDKLTYAGSIKNIEHHLKRPNFSFVQGDITDVSDVKGAISEVTHIVNFAAESHVDRSIINSSDFILTNVVGTQVLLDAALRNSVTKFVQVSTDEVYGSIEKGSWDEDYPLLPNSPYAASKAAADLVVRSYWKTHQLNINITRCTNNFGTRQYPEKLIPLFSKLLAQGEKVPLYGDGNNTREWIHVLDHCDAVWKVLYSGRSGEIYNVGGGHEYTNLDLVKMLIGIIPGASLDQIEYVEDRKGHDLRYSVNWEKIRENLHYQPSKNFNALLSETVFSFIYPD